MLVKQVDNFNLGFFLLPLRIAVNNYNSEVEFCFHRQVQRVTKYIVLGSLVGGAGPKWSCRPPSPPPPKIEIIKSTGLWTR